MKRVILILALFSLIWSSASAESFRTLTASDRAVAEILGHSIHKVPEFKVYGEVSLDQLKSALHFAGFAVEGTCVRRLQGAEAFDHNWGYWLAGKILPKSSDRSQLYYQFLRETPSRVSDIVFPEEVKELRKMYRRSAIFDFRSTGSETGEAVFLPGSTIMIVDQPPIELAAFNKWLVRELALRGITNQSGNWSFDGEWLNANPKATKPQVSGVTGLGEYLRSL